MWKVTAIPCRCPATRGVACAWQSLLAQAPGNTRLAQIKKRHVAIYPYIGLKAEARLGLGLIMVADRDQSHKNWSPQGNMPVCRDI